MAVDLDVLAEEEGTGMGMGMEMEIGTDVEGRSDTDMSLQSSFVTVEHAV